MRKTKPPYPSYDDRPGRAKTRPHAVHVKNPAGSKFLLRAFKAKHGEHAKTYEEARAWYASYLAEKDAAARRAEQKRKDATFRRRFPWLAHRLPEAA